MGPGNQACVSAQRACEPPPPRPYRTNHSAMPYSGGTLAQTSPHLHTPPTPLKPAGTCQHMPHRLAHANICALLPKSRKSAHPSAITQPPPLHPLANTYNPMHGLAPPPHLSILNVSGQCSTPTYPWHTCNTCQHQARSPKHPLTNTA